MNTLLIKCDFEMNQTLGKVYHANANAPNVNNLKYIPEIPL